VGFFTQDPPFEFNPYEAMNEYDQWLFGYLSNQKGVESNFANVYNQMQANSSSIKKIMSDILKALFNLLKDKFVQEKNYAEKKRKVYSVKIPKNLNSPLKKKINSVFDLDELLESMKIPLIFNMDQKLQILVIIKEMQNNMEKISRDPKHIDKYTTQVFLSGPPGTGKTQLVYLLSEITGLPMVVLSSSELILLGYEGIRVLQEILEEVRESGAILFIDEAELFLMNREDLITLTEESYKQSAGGQSSEFSEILHRLLTTFLASTGNQKHNIFISSNKIDVFDSAIRRRIKYFLYLNLPDNETLGKIFLNYLKKNNISFADMTNQQAARLVVEYNKNLKKNGANRKNALIGFSGSDAKVMVNSLKEYLKPKVFKDINYYVATKSDLIRVIEERLNIYALFGFNISMQSSGGLALDSEEIETEFEKAEKIRAMKRLMQDLIDEAKNHELIIKLVFGNRVDEGYVLEIKNIHSLHDASHNRIMIDKVQNGFRRSQGKHNVSGDVVIVTTGFQNSNQAFKYFSSEQKKDSNTNENIFSKNGNGLPDHYHNIVGLFQVQEKIKTQEEVQDGDKSDTFMANKTKVHQKDTDKILDQSFTNIYNQFNKSVDLHTEEFIG
jgi:SpoVK/Ycf46/Vps4 family AAA+-type ATPase